MPGNSAVLGTHTSCSTSSLVSDARSDSLPFWSLAEKPFVSVGTTNPWIDLSSVPVFAQMMAACAVEVRGRLGSGRRHQAIILRCPDDPGPNIAGDASSLRRQFCAAILYTTSEVPAQRWGML